MTDTALLETDEDDEDGQSEFFLDMARELAYAVLCSLVSWLFWSDLFLLVQAVLIVAIVYFLYCATLSLINWREWLRDEEVDDSF